uniref:Uncharacterized protein n=1 Tax=Desulfobacca acetoxidans TaxID=60893 RepID=A0A7C3V5A3_9BACT
MKFYEVERIKKLLGLPPEAGNREIEARISELMALEGAGKTLPPEEEPEVPAEEKGSLVTELSRMEFEPLLPVEKKLISWSIALGIVGLGFLVWVSYTFFPGGH